MRSPFAGIRARSAGAFAILALVLSVTLSTVTFQLARWYLLDQREQLATRQVTLNALVARGFVAASDTADDEVAGAVRALTNARSVIRIADAWFSSVVELNEDSVPAQLSESIQDGGAAYQRIEVNGTPYLLIGVSLPDVDSAYFEFVPLGEYQQTLRTLLTVLVIGATLTTFGGAFAGWIASKRLMRPLGDVAHVATVMSGGDLSTRLESSSDPDLKPVVQAFNEMASSLEARIERELRFTADVSHELRTPLTAMASAVSLAKRSEISGRAEFAIGVLDEQVDHLRRLTLELLEISRIDAGAVALDLEPVAVVELTLRVMEALGVDASRLRSSLHDDDVHVLDGTRFERILANLLENADRYGGGCTSIELLRSDGDLVVHVDDAGPGVLPEARIAIFGRFHRGNAEQPHDKPKGTGLGLALVDEHVRLHGGDVFVTESPSGGARFVVRIPGDER